MLRSNARCIIILIDTREQKGPYLQKQFKSHGIDAEIITFSQETGTDYLISNLKGSCAVQRKVALPELVSELDEIMYEIVPRLKNYSDNPVLLVEENFAVTPEGYLISNDGRETQMLATSYYGFLETIRKSGVDVCTTRDLNHTLWWMIAMHGYLEKEHYPKHRKYFDKKEQAVGMLMCVQGIGEAKAGKALQHQSIRAMCGMKNIAGLTEKQSERLQNVLRWKDGN